MTFFTIGFIGCIVVMAIGTFTPLSLVISRIDAKPTIVLLESHTVPSAWRMAVIAIEFRDLGRMGGDNS